MPRCENEECGLENIPPTLVFKGVETDKLYCANCVGVEGLERMAHHPIPEDTSLVLGREFDYGLSYNKKDGLKGGIRLGGASLSLDVSSSELDRTFGPSA